MDIESREWRTYISFISFAGQKKKKYLYQLYAYGLFLLQ